MPRLKSLAPRISEGAGRPRKRRAPRPARPHYKKWYSLKRWQDLRKEIFKRDGWVCQATGIACLGEHPAPDSPVCDHKIPHRGRPRLFWDPANLQTVCKEWHDREKQRLEAMGDLDPD